jgi:hypothetical protein
VHKNFQNSMASPPVSRETYENQKPKLIAMATKPVDSGLDVENQSRLRSRQKLFS